MLIIKAKTLSQAWEKSVVELHQSGKTTDDPEVIRDDTLVLDIKEPLNEDKYHNDFPMKRELMEEYNKYIINGGDKGNVLFEHALYHDRIFSFPPTKNNQLDAVVERLKSNPHTKRAQISFWYPDIDQEGKKVPCLQILWFRVENGKLVMHAHMRANDAYKKLLMNLNIFSEVLRYVAEKLELPPGNYIHFVDSFHIYKEDEKDVNRFIKNIARI